MLVALIAPGAGPFIAHAAAPATDPAPAADTSARLPSAGSRLGTEDSKASRPLSVVTRADIERDGFRTFGDLLQTLVQNTTASLAGDLAVAGFTPDAQVANLRNLGPGYTLVLIDGRRPPKYPQPYDRDYNVTNLEAIPTSIIERVEVLAAGASAIHGPDAVAGVINIVTRRRLDGHEARAMFGATEHGGGESADLEYVTGRSGERWSSLVALQYSKTEPVFAHERAFLADSRNGPLGADVDPAQSLVAIRRSGPGRGLNAYYPGEAACARFGYTTLTTPTAGTYCGSYTHGGSASVLNREDAYSGHGAATFDLGGGTSLFGSASYYASRAGASSSTPSWGTSRDPFNRTRGDSQTSVYFDPQFGSLIRLRRVLNPFEIGGHEAAMTEFDESTWQVSGGIAGTLAGRFDWQGAFATSHYDYRAERPRLMAQAMHDYFLGPRLGFRNGFPVHRLDLSRWSTPLTPEQYRTLSTDAVTRGESSSSTVDFTVSGELYTLPAGAIAFAAVLESHRETTDYLSDPRAHPLRPLDAQTLYDQTFWGDTHGERTRHALGTELRLPVTARLDVHAAGRYELHDDTGATDGHFSHGLALAWRPLDALLLRASHGAGHRAPDLQQVFAQGTVSDATVFDEYACRSGTGLGQGVPATPRTPAQCNRAGDPTRYRTATTVAGNPLLEGEDATTSGVGFAWTPTDRLSLSADYWRIRLENVAWQPNAAYVLANEANCRLGTTVDGAVFAHAPDSTFCRSISGLVTRLPTASPSPDDQRIDRLNRGYINGARTDASGVDAALRYTLPSDRLGTFDLDLAYSVSIKHESQRFDTDPVVDERNLRTGDHPRSRARGSIQWRTGAWSTSVFGTRYGSAANRAGGDFVNAAGGFSPARLPPYMLYNLHVSRQLSPGLSASATVVNVLDHQYRHDNSATAFPFFDPFIGADPVGRRLFVTVRYRY